MPLNEMTKPKSDSRIKDAFAFIVYWFSYVTK